MIPGERGRFRPYLPPQTSAHPCGRIDRHDTHEWRRPRYIGEPAKTYACTGTPITEGGQECVGCQRPNASCRCQDELEAERNAEWWAS